MIGVHCQWHPPSSPESKTLSLGRLWCFGKTLEVWIFWLPWPWFLEHTKHILLVFCSLSALTVALCPVNCVKSLLKTCHSVLAQLQTDLLLVPLFSWRLIHSAREFCRCCYCVLFCMGWPYLISEITLLLLFFIYT